MKKSTKEVYKKIEDMRGSFFYSKRLYSTYVDGEATVENRFNQFLKQAEALRLIAETTAARSAVDRFIKDITNEAIKTLKKLQAEAIGDR